MKPPWFGRMRRGNIGFNLFAMTFARILYETLQRDMGWNLSKEEAFFSFGIKARKDELVAPPILQDF
jgi:hypothetical protein